MRNAAQLAVGFLEFGSALLQFMDQLFNPLR
jgi:hypothetical protein